MLFRSLRRCLQKDLTRRLRDATDVRIEIEETQAAASAPAVLTLPAPVPTRAVSRRAASWGLSCLIAAVIGGIAIWELKPAPPKPVTRTVVPLPPDERLEASIFPAVALSPDGSQLAYVASRGGVQQIYLRAMGSLEARPVTGTENAQSPSFSPDGQWLGFAVGGRLKKVSVSGGAPVTLAGGVNVAAAN